MSSIPPPIPNLQSKPGSAKKPVQSEDYAQNTAIEPTNSRLSPRSRKPYNLTNQTTFDPTQPPRNLFNRVTSFVDNNVTNVMTTPSYSKGEKQKNVQILLIQQILENPLVTTPEILYTVLGIPNNAFTLSCLTQLLQMAIQIAVICLSSRGLRNDVIDIKDGVWAFLIAQASIILAVSTLFTFRVLKLGRRGTGFYTILAFCLAISAFGVVLGILMPTECTNTKDYCRTRKATTGLVSLSSFVWLSEIVIFITIVYVARLDLIQDPEELDVENQTFRGPSMRQFSAGSQYPQSEITNVGEPNQFLKTPAAIIPTAIKDPEFEENSEKVSIRKYIISETGLDLVERESQLDGLHPVQIYTKPPLSANTSDVGTPN